MTHGPKLGLIAAGGLLLTSLFIHTSAHGDHPTTTPTTQPATQPAGPKTYTVREGSLNFDVQVESVFLPVDAFELRPRFKAFSGGVTVRSAAPHATYVKKGDTLIECDSAPIKWALESAQNEVTGARANLKKAEADQQLGTKADALALRIQQNSVKNAETGLQWWERVDGPQTLLASELSVRQAKYNSEDQEDELDQLRKMYKSEDLTSATADIVIKRAVRRADISKTLMQMQSERREKTQTFEYPISKQAMIDSVEKARQQLASLQISQEQTVVARRNAVATARIALEQAEQRLADLTADSAFFSIKSPVDGLVMYDQVPEADATGQRALKNGDRFPAGQVVLRVVTPGRLRLDLNLSELQAFWVDAGMKARVTPAAFPHLAFEGTCGQPLAIPRSSPPGFGFSVPITLTGVEPRLLPGMKASVRIQAPKTEKVLLVPLSSVSASRVTIVHNDGRTESRDVTVGRSDGKQIEIRSGLTAGDQILLSPKS